MKCRNVIGWGVLVLLLASISGVAVARHEHAGFGGRYGRPQVWVPRGKERALVIVMPDAQAPERARLLAHGLAADGALVAVIDTGGYLHRLGQRDGIDCSQVAADAEKLGKKLLRRQGIGRFQAPLLVGDGSGAVLVRQVMAAGAPAAFAGAVVTDATAEADGLACSSRPPPDGAGALLAMASDSAPGQVERAVVARFPAVAPDALPLIPMPVPGSRRLAIFISGDGGWRELDQGVSQELVRQGVSVVGWDSLHYFWTQRSPAQAGADLARVLADYRQRWQADDVALVGYSFGADVMPFLYAQLPEEQRRHVHFVSLLGLSHGADFKVRVGGWLGFGSSREVPVLPEAMRMDPARVQCIQGREEKDTLCPELRAHGFQVVERPGGHHFDRDPARLAAAVLQGWQQAGHAGAALARR